MHSFFCTAALDEPTELSYHGCTMSKNKRKRPQQNAETQLFLDELERECRKTRATLTRRQLSEDEAALRKRILKAFKGVTCKEERALLECYAWDDYLNDPQLLTALRALEERRDWVALPPELLLVCADGRYHAGPEAFRFILPAYMLLSLDYDSEWMTDLFFYAFGSTGSSWKQEQYSLLSAEQRATVEQWVDSLRQRELWDDSFPLPWSAEG